MTAPNALEQAIASLGRVVALYDGQRNFVPPHTPVAVADIALVLAALAEARSDLDAIRDAAADADLHCWGPAYNNPEEAHRYALRLRILIGYPLPTHALLRRVDAAEEGLAAATAWVEKAEAALSEIILCDPTDRWHRRVIDIARAALTSAGREEKNDGE